MKKLVQAVYNELGPLTDVIYPKIAEACKTSSGKFNAEDVFARIAKNDCQLWLAYDGEDLDGLVLTEIVDHPQARTLRFICLTGIKIDNFVEFMKSAGEWLAFVGQIEQWGKSLGCVLSEIEGPHGWRHLMKDHGYESTHLILNKRLV